MKKENVINLIKYFANKNEAGFRNEAYLISQDFSNKGDYQLAEHILGILAGDNNTFVPQIYNFEFGFLKKIKLSTDNIPLPKSIKDDITGIIRSTKNSSLVNKFLFSGLPGTGKTESAKYIAQALKKDLYLVDFSTIIDSKLGQTTKNISQLFEEINNFSFLDKIVILFDEIDALGLNRTDSQDLREMGRAVSALLKGLDELSQKVLLIATTNLQNYLDKALLRRFDYIVNFDRYTKKELLKIAENILDYYLTMFENTAKNKELFIKILNVYDNIPLPGDLKNIIKISFAFCNINDPYDYLRQLYIKLFKNIPGVPKLKEQGFSKLEISILKNKNLNKIEQENDLEESIE
ncbi:ATP-binding protein [Mycoplasma sp. 1654_15]|uniref:ATP-binding protein n=1 Tax=Mycoplasma sp. 1654_15 TaxID=2725994 RepID=UPI0014492C2B|nr:ATP-binding protein [Mycoplasma sp. 1654_15]QJB71411.1 AAA family ATPase [Mycoplasma sp. 1654_15]